jgi:hypothetical protein
MSQKIVIISGTIFPHRSPRSHRATELAKELVRQGHEVTLAAVLGSYDYTRFQCDTGVIVRDLGISKFEWRNSDIKQLELPLWRKGIIYVLRKLFAFPDILVGIRTARFLKKCGHYDRLITVAVPYPIHWGAAYAKRHYSHLKETIWASDCGDPYMGNPHSRHPFYFKWIEEWWCRTTDYIVIPTELAIDGYYPEFHDKIRIIPQGFEFKENLKADYKKNPKPTFAYSGMVYPGMRDPRAFLDYLTEKKEDFLFIVYTNKPGLFMPYLERLSGRIEMRDYVPHDQLITELSKMDFLINIRNESSVQLPSKLIDYYMTGRPILEISSVFTEKDAFEDFCRADYHSRLVIHDPERFDIKNVAKSFIELR